MLRKKLRLAKTGMIGMLRGVRKYDLRSELDHVIDRFLATDKAGFAERLALLKRQPSLRRQMASWAYYTVRDGGYRAEDMVQRHLGLFERVLRDAERGGYRRPPGKILPPPSLKTEVFLETWLTPSGRRCAQKAKRILQRVFSKGKVQTQ